MSNKTQQTGQKTINADLMLSIAEIEKDIALSKDALYWMNMLKALGVEECEKLYNDYATLVKPLSITLQLAVVIRHYETIANMYLACNDTSQAKDYNDRAAEMRKIITEKAEKEVLEKAYSKLFDKLKDPQHNDSSILRDKFTALQSDDERDAWAAKRSQAEVNGLVKILDAYHNLHRVVISSNGFNESHRTKSQALIDEKISEDLKSAFARISKPFPSSKPKIVEITSQYYKPPTSSSDPLITDHVAQIDDTPKASVAAAATYSNDSSKEEEKIPNARAKKIAAANTKLSNESYAPVANKNGKHVSFQAGEGRKVFDKSSEPASISEIMPSRLLPAGGGLTLMTRPKASEAATSSDHHSAIKASKEGDGQNAEATKATEEDIKPAKGIMTRADAIKCEAAMKKIAKELANIIGRAIAKEAQEAKAGAMIKPADVNVPKSVDLNTSTLASTASATAENSVKLSVVAHHEQTQAEAASTPKVQAIGTTPSGKVNGNTKVKHVLFTHNNTKAPASADINSVKVPVVRLSEIIAKEEAEKAAKEVKEKAEAKAVGSVSLTKIAAWADATSVKTPVANLRNIMAEEHYKKETLDKAIAIAKAKADRVKADMAAEEAALAKNRSPWTGVVSTKAQAAAKAKAEAKARVKAQEEARAKAEEEARAKAEEEARAKAEEEARLKAEEEARVKAEEEARVKAEEEARAKVVAEAKAKKAAKKAAKKEEADAIAKATAEVKATEKAAKAAAETRAKEEAEAKKNIEKDPAVVALKAAMESLQASSDAYSIQSIRSKAAHKEAPPIPLELISVANIFPKLPKATKLELVQNFFADLANIKIGIILDLSDNEMSYEPFMEALYKLLSKSVFIQDINLTGNNLAAGGEACINSLAKACGKSPNLKTIDLSLNDLTPADEERFSAIIRSNRVESLQITREDVVLEKLAPAADILQNLRADVLFYQRLNKEYTPQNNIISALSNIQIAHILRFTVKMIDEPAYVSAATDILILRDIMHYISQNHEDKGKIFNEKIRWNNEKSTLGAYIASKQHRLPSDICKLIMEKSIILVPQELSTSLNSAMSAPAEPVATAKAKDAKVKSTKEDDDDEESSAIAEASVKEHVSGQAAIAKLNNAMQSLKRENDQYLKKVKSKPKTKIPTESISVAHLFSKLPEDQKLELVRKFFADLAEIKIGINLDLSGNDMTHPPFMEAFKTFLSRNKTIKSINLTDNNLASGGLPLIRELSSAFGEVPTLDTIDLSGNNFSRHNIEKFAKKIHKIHGKDGFKIKCLEASVDHAKGEEMLSQEAFQAVREQIKIALRKPDPQKYIEGIISKLSNIHIADILCHIANIIETRIEAFDGDAIADSVIFEDAIRYIAKYLKTKGVILTQKIYWDGKESTLGEYIASKSHKFSPELAQSISKGEIILVPPKPPTIAALDIISAADNIEADMGHGPVNQQDMDITGAAAD